VQVNVKRGKLEVYLKTLSVNIFSYDIWAQQISNTIGKTSNIQAIWKIIHQEFTILLTLSFRNNALKLLLLLA